GALPAAGGEFRGRLILGEKPAVGVSVVALPFESSFEEARREARGEPAPAPIARATTDDKGEFRLTVEAQQEPFVRLRAEGKGVHPRRLGGQRILEAREGDDLEDETLSPATKLTGRIVDAAGAPLPGAEVLLSSMGEIQRAVSGREGEFAF